MIKKARVTLEEIPLKPSSYVNYIWVWVETFERNYQGVLNRLSSVALETFEYQDVYITKDQLKGYAYLFLKKPELACSSFESARLLLEKKIKERQEDPRIHSSLGVVYAALGQKQEAIREGKFAVQMYPDA